MTKEEYLNKLNSLDISDYHKGLMTEEMEKHNKYYDPASFKAGWFADGFTDALDRDAYDEGKSFRHSIELDNSIYSMRPRIWDDFNF